MMQRNLLFVLFSLFLYINIFGQETPTPKTIAELKIQLENEMQKQHVAGMMLTIAIKDTTLFVGGLGYADMEKKTPVTEKHLFRQASITKLFVALGIFNLVKDGKLTFQTKLADIAPDIPFSNKWEATNPITIEQLLEHTTGFSDKSPLEEYNFSGKILRGLDAVNVFKKYMVSKWRPNERHAYSNVNYAILAYIIEKITQKPLDTYLREAIFTPLNMPCANVQLTHNGSEAYSKGYFWENGALQNVPHQPQYSAGNGSLNACALDYENALKAFLNNRAFLSKELLDDIETPQTYLSAKAGLTNNYGRGNEANDIDGHIFRGHRGAIGGYLSAFLYNRDLGVGYAFSLNTANYDFYRYADNLIGKFITQNINNQLVKKEYALQKEAIKPYLGYYRLSNPSQLYTGFLETFQHTFKLTEQENAVQVNLLLGGTMTWQAADSTQLLFTNASRPHIAFLKDSDGQLAIADNTLYFKKISAFEAWAPLVLTLLSVLFIISSIVFGIFNLMLFLFKKLDKSSLLIRFSPIFATIGFIIIVATSTQYVDYMKAAKPIDTLTLGWQIGKYIFAIFTLCSLFLLVFKRKNLKNKWLKGYLVVLTLGQLYILGLLVWNNWYF
jgi:CubicO group peptidase (beta-lactamase class C family)